MRAATTMHKRTNITRSTQDLVYTSPHLSPQHTQFNHLKGHKRDAGTLERLLLALLALELSLALLQAAEFVAFEL